MLVYRELTTLDWSEYRRIRLECLQTYPNNFGTTYDEELNDNSPRFADVIKAPKKNSFMAGAITGDNKLVGICGFVAEQRLKAKHRGEIVQMYVDPFYSGQGIAKKLLAFSVSRAFASDQIEQIVLSVAATNNKAINLYKQFGFIEYGKLDNYFKSGNDYTSQLFFVLSKPRK